MLILDFQPNWKTPVSETREYLTNIMTSYDQTEQRAALRSKPRCTLSYTALLHGADASLFDWIVTAGQAQVLLVPYWPLLNTLAAPAANGDTTIQLANNLPSWVVPGERLVLLGGSKDSQAVEVLSVAGKTITLNTPVPGNWGAGAAIYPTWECRLPDSVPFKRHTTTVSEVALTLTRQVTGDAVPVASLPADMTYNSTEVLTRDINWRAGQDVDMAWVTQLMDGQVGRTSYEVLAAQQQRTSGGTILVRDTAEMDWWWSFFDRHKGRRGVFYAPTRSRDLPLIQSPTPAVSPFAVAGTRFYSLAQPGTTMLTHIMVKLKDQTCQLYEITGLQPDYVNDVTYIKTMEPWSLPYRPEDALCFYLASKCRLASDAINVSWLTAGIGEIKVSTTTVGANW